MDETKMGTGEHAPGMSIATLIELPDTQREVMRLLLRHPQMTYHQLARALDLLPLDDTNRRTLDEALGALAQQGYLIRAGVGDAATYRARLRRRARRDLTPIDLHLRAGGRLPLGLWSTLMPTPDGSPQRPRPGAVEPAGEPTDEGLARGSERPARRGSWWAQRARAWLAVAPLLWLLGTNALVLGLVDVVATSGFVSQVGPRRLPWLWIANMLVILLSSATYALVVDRVKRVRLMAALLVGFAGLFAGVVALFVLGAPDGLTYLLLVLIAEQQEVLFPLAFWALASDLYTTAESKRVFPLLAAGHTGGLILGYLLIAGLAALRPEQAESAPLLLGLGAVLYLLGLAVLWATFRRRVVRTRQSREEAVGLRDSVAVGFDVTRHVPLFRYLASCILLVWVAVMPLQYHFLSSMDRVSAQGEAQFETLYGLYNIVVIVVTLALQSLVAARLMQHVPLRSAPAGLPAALLVAVGCALVLPGFAGAVSAYFLLWLVYDVWDTPVRHALESLIPDERRGRVLAFVENYTYATGCILGSLLLGLLIFVASRAGLSDQVVSPISLLAAAGASVGAVWAALRLRAKYEESLFDWRLAKARRKSVLEGIEF